jgi:hypothetical protein
MEITLSVGVWGIPVLLTALAFLWALIERKGDYQDFFGGLPVLIRLVGATIGSLVIWIVYLVYELWT